MKGCIWLFIKIFIWIFVSYLLFRLFIFTKEEQVIIIPYIVLMLNFFWFIGFWLYVFKIRFFKFFRKIR